MYSIVDLPQGEHKVSITNIPVDGRDVISVDYAVVNSTSGGTSDNGANVAPPPSPSTSTVTGTTEAQTLTQVVTITSGTVESVHTTVTTSTGVASASTPGPADKLPQIDSDRGVPSDPPSIKTVDPNNGPTLGASNDEINGREGSDKGRTIGIAAGSVVGTILLLALLSWFLIRRRKRHQSAWGDDYSDWAAPAMRQQQQPERIESRISRISQYSNTETGRERLPR